MARGRTPKKTKEVPFGLDKIEQYNAEKEAVESEEEADANSGDDEEVLDLGLSDDEYDFGGDGDEEEGEEEEEEDDEDGGYAFDEAAYDRKEKLRKMDEDDADLLDLQDEDDEKRPFSMRLDRKELHGADRGDDSGDIEEAKRLAKERASNLMEDDFDMDNSVLKSKKKSKDERLREQFDADLDAIDFGKTEVQAIPKKIDDAVSVQDKLDKIKRESPELLSFLQELKEKSHELNDTIIPVLQKVKSKQLPTSQGISFLEAKHRIP